MEYKLNDEISLKYIENVKIDAINYYKYNINNLKIKSNSKTLYFNKEINLDEIDKEKLSSYITEKTSSSNEENIFINLDEFMLKNNSSFSGGGETQSNSSGNGNINLLNFEDFDKALGLIRGAKECNLSSLSNALTNFETLGGENKNIDTGIFNISTKINRLGKGDGPVALVDNYISVYEDILSGIIETYATDQKTKAEAGKLELNQSTLDIEGAENAIKNGLIDYTTKILDGDVKPKTLGEYFKEINTIYNNYSTSSVKDMEDVLNAAKLTEDSEALKDMDEEDRKSYIEAKNKQLDGMYESVKDTLNISRDEFDRLLQNDTGKLAELLAEQSRTEVANRLNGVEDIGGVNSFYFEIENLWYSSEAGQQALFEKFKIDSPTKFDDENALAYTEYIKYCMSREHSQDWLREDLRKFSNVVSKIDTTGTFSYLSDKEVTKEELEYIESFMAASGGFLPYGYEKVGDTYKRREYTKQGEDMLYYMDYHCGEDVLKKDEDRIITAFSNQGKLDAYERNYKGVWINSQLTGNYSSETQKQVAIDNAERDYNILNGIIEDEKRKQQLIDEGHLSFEQLVTFVNNNNIDLKELSNKEYIDKNKETIIKETGLSEAQLYNFAITGTVTPTGYADIDGTMQGTATLFSSLSITGLQALSGIDKFFENIGDAAKTAVKSDFILNFGNNENIYLDLSESVELTKEFKEYRDSVWKKYLDSELYKEQYEKFKDSASIDKAVKDYYDKYLFDPLTGQYRGLDGKKYYLYEDISDKEKEAIGQKLLPDLFKESKFKEWDLNDSSSSNYYLATFKEGIRNGGDFSSFDDLDSTVIKNAKEQIETINEVSVDKTGTWWNENIYNKDWYNTMETFSFVKKDNILGMTANQIGNMAIPVGLSALGTALGMPALGQVLSSTALFTSAFGGAAEEAFLSGASYNEALGYATLSAGTELVIEKVFSGIAGFGEGWMDEVIDFIPNKAIDAVDFLIKNKTGKSDVLKGNVLTQTIKSLITGGIGEGIEEVATDLVTPLWQSLTYMNEKSYGDIVGENVSIESLKQTFLVSFLSSMVFGSSEISQKTNSFNKQMQNLTNEVGNIPGFKEQANKILADIIGYDAQYLTTDIITKTIENNAKQIELNPENQTALKELQQKLTDAYQDLTENSVELKTEEGSVKLSKELIMNISDIAGLNQKNILNRKDGVVIDGDKLSFKNPKTQQKFISALYDNAKNVISNQIKLNNETISQLQEALKLTKKDIIRIEDINSAIQTLKELGDRSHFSETFGSVILEIAGKEISIPTSVVHEITSKYNIKDGKIEFTEENMNGKEFASKILSKAIGKLYLKNSASMEEIQNFNEASKKGNIKLLEKASVIIGNKLDTFVVNSTKVDGKDLIKLEVKTNRDGEYRSVNIYVDSSTNPTVYMHNDLLAEKIQEIINKNISKENIYLGEIVYDKKNDELIVEQNEENNSYVESLKTFMMEENLVIHPYEIVDGTNKTTVNIYLDAQTDTNILENNNVKKKVNEIIETKRKQNLDAKDIYIGKIELKDGQPKITTARGQKAFVDSKTENIVTTERTNITGTNLIKVEAYVTINGKTEKVNAYIDSKSNTNLLSKKNAKQKIFDIIIEEKTQNKDVRDVYVGEIVNDKKNGNVVVNQNEATLEQFRNTIIASTVINSSTNTSNSGKVVTENTTNKTTVETEKENKKAVTEEIIIDTKNIFNEKNAKNELDKFIKNIEKNIKDFVSKNKDAPDFITRLEQLKSQTSIEFNQKIVELSNRINESYNSVIETINKKIESLNENDPQIEKLKTQIDSLTQEREEAIKKFKEYDSSKIDEIFNSVDTTSDVNVNNDSFNFLVINESIKKATEQMNLFVEKIKNEYQRFVGTSKKTKENFDEFVKEQRNKFNNKLDELKINLSESYNKKLRELNEKIDNAKENNVLKDKLISAKNELITRYNEQVKNLIEKSSAQFEETINNLKTKFNSKTAGLEKNNNNSQKSISNEQNMVDIIENHGAESDLYDEVVYIKDKNSKFNRNEFRNLIATYMNKTNPDFRKKRSNLLKSKNITRVEDYIQFLKESNMHWFQMESQGFEQTGEHLKIYLSIDNSDLHLFSRLLLEELIDNNTAEYCFKIKAKDDRVRRDSFVLYCNEDNFTQFAEIIQKVIDNNPSIKFNDPNPLAIQYSDKIYCGFDSYTSYTDRMCHAINELKNQGKTTAEIIEGLETFRKNNMPEGLKNILENNTDNQVYAPEGDYISPQQLTYVIDKMIDKYGEEGTTEIIIKYLNTGRAEYIPNYNGERSIITSIDKNILINYINRNYNSQTSNTRGNTYSRLYQLFSTNKRNNGTFGTDQSVIQKVLSEVGVDRAFNMVFGSQIDNAHYLESLSRMKLDTSSFIDALNNNRGNYMTRDVYKLIDFINSSDVIQLVKNNYPGMSEVEAIRFLYLVEGYTGSRGICNYAAAVNMIFQKYMGNEMEFERTFGYPMYTLNNEGKKVLNDRMLIVDMYSIINRDKLVKKINGKYEIVETNSEYLNLASGNKQNYGKFKLDYLKEFIDAKGIKLGLKETFYYSSSLRNISWNKDLVLKIKDSLEKGENINVTAAGFDLLDLNGKIARTNIGSHIMTVVGITNDGKLIVDSWGRELLLDLKSTISNLGREYIVNGEKRTRLVAITGYELTDKAIETKKTSLFDKILNPLKSEESLETFDTSKEIDMIDESVSNMNSKDAENITIPSSFEVTSINILTRENITINIDTKTLEELVQDSSKLASKLTGLFNLNLPPTAIKDGVIKYIDFAKENNIEIQIDKNVQKWYEAVKNAKENNHILINEDDVIRKGVEPKTRLIYEFDSVKYGKYFGEIKITELLDMIEGKRNVTLAPQELTTALNELSKYINENGIKLNKNITNKLNQIVNIDNSHVVVNPIEVVNGATPIILNKYIKVNVRNVSTLKLVELISNKYNLVGYINNKFYIDELQHIDIEREVIALFNESPELAIQYNEVLDLIKEAKNNYALFDYINKTYIILPKEINGVNIEEILQFRTLSKVELNRRINTLDMEVLNKYKSTVDSIISIVKEKGSQVDVSDLINIKTQIEVPNETRRNVFGILHKAYSSNEEIGGTYGPEQSAIGIKLSKIQLKSSIETLFKTKMTDIEFFKHLGLDSVTQEKFKKILYKNCRKQNGIFAKMFGDYVNNEVVYQELQKLADIVKKNIPELNDKQAFMFLYYMEAGEIGTKGICSYADAASIIINKYLGDPIKFEKDFGFPMYTVNSKGDRIYNYEMLIVDMYSNINKETLLTIDDKTGNIIFEPTNKNQTYLGDFDIGLNQEVLNKYFKDKNIELSLNKTFDFNSEKDVMHYEKVLEEIANELEKGNTVHLYSKGFALVNEQGHDIADDIGGHAMTVLGINSDGNLVVNSWGKVAIFDLKTELAKTGNQYFDTDANGNVSVKGTSSLIIQSFEIKDSATEFEGVIELTRNSKRANAQSTSTSEVKINSKSTILGEDGVNNQINNQQELRIIESINIVDVNGVVNFEKLKLEIAKVTEYIRNMSENFFNQKYSDNSITNGVSYYNKFRSEQHKYYDKEIGKVIKTVLEKASEIGNEIYKLNLELQELESNDTNSERINELLSNYRKSKIYDVKKIIKNKIKNLEINKGQLLLQVEKAYEIANSEFTNAILKPIYDKYYGVYEKIASRYDKPNGLFMNSARYKLQLRNLHRNLVSQYGQVDAAYFIEEIGNKYIREHSIKLTGNNFELSNILERLDKNIISKEKIDVLSTIIQELNLKLKENNIIIRIQDNLIGSNSIDNLILNLQSINNSLDTVKNVNEMLVNKSNAVIPNEIVIVNTMSPSNFVSQYHSNSTREVKLNAKTDNIKTMHIYDSIVTEEKIVHQYAHLLAKNIIANNPSFVKEWIIAMSNDTKYVSNYAQVSIIEDIVETITKSIMYPIGPRECDSKYSYRFALIRGTNKLPNSGIFENANKKYNLYIQGKRGTFVYEDVYEDVSISDKRKYSLRNNIEILQFDDKVIEDYDYKGYVKHLILDGEIFEDGIYGAHSMKYFNELVRNSKDSEGNARIKIIEKIKHPTINGLYRIKYSVDGVEITNPKTIYDPSKISDNLILEFANEAIDNKILIDDGQGRNYIGMASNGMIYQMHYDNNVLQSIYPVFEPSDVPTSLIVPIKVRKEIYYIPVNIDAQRNRDTFRYGKSIINRVQREFMKLSEQETENIILGNGSIDLGQIKYNPRTGEIDTIIPLNDTYASIPTTTLLDFVKLDVDSMAKVLINKEQYNGYDAEEMLDAIIEVYNYSKDNNIIISINPNLEHFIKEYQKVKLEDNNELSNLRRALYNKESIISIPTSIKVPSYRSVSVNILFDILNGKKDISTTYYSEIDIYDATKELLKYFEGKNVTISEKIKRAFDEAKNIDENSTIINFIDVLNGKEKIVLPKTIKGKYGNSNISDVIQYLNGDSSFISTGVIENLKEYINANNLYIPSDMMDKINLLSSLGEDNVLLNEKAYLKGESSPIIVPKNLEGIYTNTSNIHGWITGEEKLYNLRTIEEVIKLTTKFTEYIYSNNIMLDNATMSKLEVLKNLKEDETIINLEEFFNGSSAIIVKNSINVNGTNIKLSTILDTINLTDNTHLKILSGKNIDGVTRENIFDAIDELYKVRPELRLTTISNYSKIKNIYDNNYIFNERYLFPKTLNDITCELIEEILTNPIRIAKYNGDKRIQIIDAINEYIELIGNEVGKYFAYNERVKMRDNLVSLMSREIPQIDLSKEVYSPLYYMFSNVKDNGGTFGTNQGVIREMLKDLGIKDLVKALFHSETITDDNFLTDLKKLDITKEKLTQALNDLFWNPNKESVVRLIDFIKNNEVIKLVQKNFPGINGVEAIRFLYLAETKEAGNNGICNYAAATNMIFNKYLGKESWFEADFGYPVYIINEQGKKVLNDRMLLVDMYSTINKGVLVKEANGKYEIATTNYNYLNLSDVGRFEMEYLQRFIDAKGIDLVLKENFYYSSYDEHTLWKEELILKIKESLEKGEYINISGSGFDLLYKNGDIAVKDCGAHIMTLVGLTPDGKVIVDSWGQELLIDLESTLEHLGEKYDSGYTRRLAIASYELTDTNNNIQNNASNQDLETFDIPKEIDMIDESTYNLERDESIEDLEPLIIDDEQVNGSNESSQNAQVKASRPQIQTENIKQLSILDNMKHTLQRINDKFTGFKTSKLNSESYYDRTTKSNNKLFKQKRINKTFRDFANRHLIDLENLISNGLLRNPKISEINSLITDNRVLTSIEDANVSIADILGTKKNIDLDKNFGLLFNEGSSEFQTRDLGLLEYTSDQILNVLSESFKTHPIVISEVNTGKYIIEDNGYHRYSILRLHYLNEYMKVKDNPLLVAELNEKYKVPVKVYKLDTIKTYSINLLKELGTNIKVKTSSVTKKSKIFIDGKKVNMTDAELIEFTKDKINSNRNATQIINKLLSQSEAFREFYNGYLANESNDYGIEFNAQEFIQNTEIQVNNKTYQLNTIIDIIENRYLEILKGKTIDGINSQNMFSIFNKVFESNPQIKAKYKSDYDNIIDIFKNKYVHENGNLYPKTFNFIKTEDIIEILKQPYKLQRYSKEKRIQITEAINQYIEYARTNNYDLVPKEYKGYLKVSKLMSKDVPTAKLTSEVKSPLLNEFRRNALKGGTFGSKQGVIRILLERNGITNAINYLFNKDATGTKFLEQIKDFTDEDFQDLLDNAVDETGRLEGLYNLYDEYELFELMRNNFEGIEDLEIIKFLYLFESTEAGAKGICNYSVAVNMIFNKYLGNEQQFKKDFGYPMYVIKDGKKILNDMMLLVDMYSIINEKVFAQKIDGVVKVTAINNKNYLPVTNPGGSFNIENLQKFLNKKGIKLDLNQTFAFDSRTDVMWKEEILTNVKHALEKGKTVNLSAQGFDLYRKDGKTIAAKDFEGHAMTVVGLTKDGNLIVDSHGMEMIVNLDLTLENAGKVYIDKNNNIKTRRIGIATYSFDSRVPSSKQNIEIIDVSDSIVNKEFDEGIFDVFSKSTGDIDLFKDILSKNKLDTLTDSQVSSLVDNIKKGKIKPKDYDLTSETIRILIDKVPLKKIFPISNVTAIKSFIDYFGVDTLVEFDRLNNGFLFENKGENLYNLFDFYDLSTPKTNESDKLKALDKLIVDTINSNKKTEYKTYTFNYSKLIGSEFAKMHSELFLDESAPQDLKEAFYNGLVNSGNEYKPEWSKYLEGKSVKGVIHEPLIGYEDVKVVENINALGENSSKYQEGLEVLAKRVGLSIEEVQEILSSKLKDLIETSEFGVRRTLKSLQSVLETGKLKNQFEVNHSSYGVSNTDMRMDMERDLFGIPRNIRYEDRPIYGMLLPQDLSSKYVHKGPGAYYSDGSGVIYIFDKSKIMNNTTLTLGDSIDQAGKICATNLSNPRYFGMFSEILSTIKTKEDLLNFSFTNLYEKTVMEVGNSAYYEFQLHGESSHTLDNLKEIVFLKMPEAKIIKKLEELNISYKVIG